MTKKTLTTNKWPSKHSQGVLLLVSWDCSSYCKGPQDNQHQNQAELRLHAFPDIKTTKKQGKF